MYKIIKIATQEVVSEHTQLVDAIVQKQRLIETGETDQTIEIVEE